MLERIDGSFEADTSQIHLMPHGRFLHQGAYEVIGNGAAHRQNKRIQMFNRTGAGPDHPTLSNYPESRNLKVLWGRVV
jgi:23S rRNA G2069 N7-methylase RlmK/C1962 C5-methylase RlmI